MAPPPPPTPATTPPSPSPPPPPPPYSIVTGANAGLGKEIALGLMQRGHHVVLACRRLDACEIAAEELRAAAAAASSSTATPAAAAPSAPASSAAAVGTCECAKLDLSDFGSVRAFAREQRKALAAADAALPAGSPGPPRRRRRLVLCQNAGVMGPPASPDQPLEPHLLTNHLGPYLLTRLLMPELKSRPGSRLVFVASRAHYAAAPVPVSFFSEEGGGGAAATAARLGGGPEADARTSWLARYSRSKLLNVQTAASAHARLAPSGSAAFAVSPGFVATSIFGGLPGWLRGPADRVAGLVARTPAQGAAVAVYACTDEGAMRGALEAVGGGGHGGGGGEGVAPLRRRVEQACESPWLFLHDNRPLRASAAARDARSCEDVWRASALVTGVGGGGDEGDEE